MSTSMENTSLGQPQSHEPAIIRRPLDHCPKCNSWQLQPVVAIDAESVHFLCGSCNRCWHVQLNYVTRVHPETCAGCPQTERCANTYESDQTSA